MELLKFAFMKSLIVRKEIEKIRNIDDLILCMYLEDLVRLLVINQAELGLTNEQFLQVSAEAYKLRQGGLYNDVLV